MTDQWFSFDSAPKDGIVILAKNSKTGEARLIFYEVDESIGALRRKAKDAPGRWMLALHDGEARFGFDLWAKVFLLNSSQECDPNNKSK